MVKIPKENEDKIRKEKEFVVESVSKIHAGLVFKNETTLDFDDYIMALAMIPLTIDTIAKTKGLDGWNEILHFIGTYLDAFPTKEEYK